MKTGDYVLIVRGVDDVLDGQLCKVIGPDETSSFHEYLEGVRVPVLCWTGFMVWTTSENLIPITSDAHETEQIFVAGMSRSESAQIMF